MKRLLILLSLAFLSGNTSIVYAQVQEVSLRAPNGIRIDGKTYEWPNNKLQVYNKINRMFYSLTNDDNNLYLTVRGPFFYAPAKMIRGGLTLTISRLLDKKARQKDKNSVAITFPYVDPKDAQSIVSSVNDYQPIARDTINHAKEHDSLVRVVNAKTIAAIKEIKIDGIKGIDSIISIYNETGIKAMGTFNRGMAFTIEIAIPLKYLGLSANDESKFSYNIKLNKPRPLSANGNNNFIRPMAGDIVNGQVLTSTPSVNPDFEFLNDTTDFWGEYTLAKKP